MIKFAKAFFYFILSALPFLACKSTEKRPVAIPEGFDWEGHRGCRGLMPENTLPAFMHALTFPQVVTLELDLAVTKDKQLIVSHEPYFNSDICLKPSGDTIRKSEESQYLIYEMTAAEVQQFDCGSIGNPRFPNQQKQKVYKPLFRDVLLAAKEKRPDIHWNIEIKSQANWDGKRHPAVEDFAHLVIAEIQNLGIEKNAVVQSFDVRALKAMHEFAPQIPLAFLIENMESFESNMTRLDFTPAIYSPYYLTVTKKMADECHARNIKLIPWTVNEVPAMRRLIRLGVDGIITDYPNKIAEVGSKSSDKK